MNSTAFLILAVLGLIGFVILLVVGLTMLRDEGKKKAKDKAAARPAHATAITPAAKPVLRGEEPVWLRRDRTPAPVRAVSRRAQDTDLDPADRPLWEALRECRKRLAAELNVPPYVVFHDATLRAMLEDRPQSLQALRGVSGVGDSKLERYGEAFLRVLKDFP